MCIPSLLRNIGNRQTQIGGFYTVFLWSLSGALRSICRLFAPVLHLKPLVRQSQPKMKMPYANSLDPVKTLSNSTSPCVFDTDLTGFDFSVVLPRCFTCRHLCILDLPCNVLVTEMLFTEIAHTKHHSRCNV